MAAAVAELEAGLNAMSALKPPGVSGSRIASLTALCVANVQSESVLIQKIYTHFKKTDGDHKLGVLYVVDSVTRKWLEQAKSQGQVVDGSAGDGTFAAGVHRVTELIPVLMNDIIQSAPDSQKEKISKLLDIWEKGQTFPQSLIDSFRAKLSASNVKSTTPDGSPPPGLVSSLGYGGIAQSSKPATPAASATPIPPATASNSNAIMEALANIARQNVSTGLNSNIGTQPTPTPPVASGPALVPVPVQPPAPTDLSRLLKSISQHQPAGPAANPTAPSYPVQQQPASAMNVPAMPYPFPTGAPSAQVPQVGAPAVANSNAGGYPGLAPTPPAAVGSAPGLNPEVQQQVVLIKALADQGVPLDKIPALVQSLQAAGMIQPQGVQSVPPTQAPYGAAQSWNTPPVTGASRDYPGYGQGRRSPERNYGRSRSRSPGGRWDSRDPYRGGRDGPERRFDDHASSGAGRNGRGSSEFRQRSPAGRRGQSPSPGGPPQHDPRTEKWVEYDRTLPQDHIRVYSRTLFVGGVTCSEQELRSIFNQCGEVQTCIVNRDKRHAFVKMVTRKDAETAKRAMERQHSINGHQLRTRWGVGFGPRDCSDYSTGVSVIPITALTEADRKWMLTAEYGGSGGRPLEGGLVVEEPDIEIGAGVSSKAISRRMQTDKGGSQGPKSTRTSDDRWRRGGKDRGDDAQSQLSGANAQPLPQQFPYGIGTMANGMPSFPPGFAFPTPDSQGGATNRS
ncbi:hypothetical protein SODALDRAFT_91138 [Sodiomyces alkalinus F11]|uniref:RNA binding protein Nrd1 n=1 Tax=Sodiomyces alkalinus (strain CBS 110278 / VKM F-3762 / F11) TaxID=1314773 RepID=A0A3N2Q0C4_SODAK|nr:hypothetical protein SODALDRAFT_91138 [Sodiomyces alkalinus F11]ROT40217.1 hypothetical protein SODALDRAFT_91138 [Sodiomyces alkalinus F11]